MWMFYISRPTRILFEFACVDYFKAMLLAWFCRGSTGTLPVACLLNIPRNYSNTACKSIMVKLWQMCKGLELDLPSIITMLYRLGTPYRSVMVFGTICCLRPALYN